MRTKKEKKGKERNPIPTHLAFKQLLLPVLRHDLAVGAGWRSLCVRMLGVGCAIGWRGVVGERVVVVVLEGMGERVGCGVVLEGIHGAIGVESISGRRGWGADGGLSAGRDEDMMVWASPGRLVVRICELVVDSGGLLRIVHCISKKTILVAGPRSSSSMGPALACLQVGQRRGRRESWSRGKRGPFQELSGSGGHCPQKSTNSSAAPRLTKLSSLQSGLFLSPLVLRLLTCSFPAAYHATHK
jgi:hypothetical protein